MARWQFITPQDVPTATKSRCLVYPDSLEWQALINGFIGQGIDRSNWQQLEGGITTDEAVEACVKILNAFFTAEECDNVPSIYIGEVRQFGLSAPPAGWLECNGDSVLIADYPDLFDAIGENFGSSVGGNFVLPDMRFRPAVGLGELDSNPAYEIGLGMKLGQEEVALGTNELPTHTHAINDPGHTHPPLSPLTTFIGNRSGGTNTLPASNQVGVAATTGSATTGIAINNAGDGNPFPLIQPILGLLTCIYAGV